MDRGWFVIVQRGPRLSPRRLDEAQMAHPTKRGERGHNLDEHLGRLAAALSTRIEGELGGGLVGRAPRQRLHLRPPRLAALPPQAHGPDAAADDRDST